MFLLRNRSHRPKRSHPTRPKAMYIVGVLLLVFGAFATSFIGKYAPKKVLQLA